MARREMTTHEASPVATTDAANFFQLYGGQASQRPIVGKLLKFSKGDWLAGQDDEEIEKGTRLVVQMDTLSVGWVKWLGQKPVEQRMGLVIEGYAPPQRHELGDTDHQLWEIDINGKPRDPWTFTNQVIMYLESDPEELFTFSGQSKGAINAIGDLCRKYGEEMRLRPGELPVVAIGSSSYAHTNKEFGRIKVPTFELVGWVKP